MHFPHQVVSWAQHRAIQAWLQVALQGQAHVESQPQLAMALASARHSPWASLPHPVTVSRSVWRLVATNTVQEWEVVFQWNTYILKMCCLEICVCCWHSVHWGCCRYRCVFTELITLFWSQKIFLFRDYSLLGCDSTVHKIVVFFALKMEMLLSPYCMESHIGRLCCFWCWQVLNQM